MMIELNSAIAETLSKTELDVIKFINQNQQRLSELSIVDIAFESYTSPATVSRAIRKCGVNGFQELRYRSLNKTERKDVHNMADVMNKSLIEAQQTLEQISLPSLLKMIELIKTSKKIYVFASGLSRYVAEEFALKLQLLEYNAVFISDPNIMRKLSAKSKKEDLLVVFSLNGQTSELVESVDNAHLSGAKVALCCCSEVSDMYAKADCTLIGAQHSNHAIKNFEVASRLPLQMIARMVIDYLVLY